MVSRRSIGLALGLLLSAAAGVAFWNARARPAAVPRDAVPAGARRFADAVTSYVVELNHGGAGAKGRSEQVLRTFSALAPSAQAASFRGLLGDLLTEMEAFMAGLGATEVEEESRRLARKVNELNRVLGVHEVPILLQAVAFGRGAGQVLLQVYHVDSTLPFETPRGKVRVSVVTRLDRLNVSLGLLGFQMHGGTSPVVLQDRQREHVIDVVLPTLSGRCLPADDHCAASYQDQVGPAAGSAIAAQLERRVRKARGVAFADRLRDLAQHVTRRREIWERWRKRYSPRLRFASLAHLSTPAPVPLPPAPGGERHAFEELQGAIDDVPEAELLIAPLMDWISRRVARHEVQHYLDELDPPDVQRGSLARYYPVLAPGPLPASVAELSAYLAEIASDPELPSITWATLARAVGSPEGGSTAVAGALAIQVLTGATIVGQGIDSDAAGRALTRFVRLRPAEQAERARRAYQEVFGRPPPAVTPAS